MQERSTGSFTLTVRTHPAGVVTIPTLDLLKKLWSAEEDAEAS
jgi:hypothetical protein